MRANSLPARYAGMPVALVCMLFLFPLEKANGYERSPVVVAEIIRRDLVDCFEEGLSSGEGQPVYCEASAIAFTGKRLILASDKPVPGDSHSAVFTFPYPGHGPIDGPLDYLTADAFISAVKYEDMTITPDGKYIIATTGFDRIKKDSNQWDGYNTLLFWPVDDPASVKVVASSNNNGVSSSLGLRGKISKTLLSTEFPDEVPYFKVESLAAIPGNRLLFGIRELGVRYDKFVYMFKIISVPYEIKNGVLSLGDFELVYDFDMDQLDAVQQSVALSSIEYDPFHDRLYLLTSYEIDETDEGLGGYLWTLSLSALRNEQAPTLVQNNRGDALQFAHKAEGITVLSENLVMVIHDDDRVLGRELIENPGTQFSRAPHQAAYSLVSLLPQ